MFGLFPKYGDMLKEGLTYGEGPGDYTKEEWEDRYNSSKVFYSTGEEENGDFRAFRENDDYYFEIIMRSEEGKTPGYTVNIIPKGHVDSNIIGFIHCRASEFFTEEVYNNFINSVKAYHGDFDAPTYEEFLNGSM